jgi:hypothetical protein
MSTHEIGVDLSARAHALLAERGDAVTYESYTAASGA